MFPKSALSHLILERLDTSHRQLIDKLHHTLNLDEVAIGVREEREVCAARRVTEMLAQP